MVVPRAAACRVGTLPSRQLRLGAGDHHSEHAEPELSPPIDFYGRRLCMPSYYYEDKRIWGLTAFMILDLINHVYDADVRFDLTGEK